MSTLLLGFGSALTLAALILVAVSFATDSWITVTVNREEIKKTAATSPALNMSLFSDRMFYSSGRGLFRTCYHPREDIVYIADSTFVDQNCVPEDGYDLSGDTTKVGYTDEYKLRIHLLRLHFALFACAILLLLVAVILGAAGCWQLNIRLLQFASGTVFLAAFLTAGGMGVFHGYEYLEKTKIDDEPQFFHHWQNKPAYLEMKNNSAYGYGYSYILGWVGMAFSAIAAILYLCAASAVYTAMREQEKRPLQNESESYLGRDKGYRNRAYDHMDRPYYAEDAGYPNYPAYPQAGYPYGGDPGYGMEYPASAYYKY